MSYTHYYENPRRFPVAGILFQPPLELDPEWRMAGVRFPPKLAAGMVFLSVGDGLIRAYDESTAQLAWEFRLPESKSDVMRADILIADEALLTVQNDEAFVLDLFSGKLLYRVTAGYPHLGPAVFDRNSLFCLTHDADLNAYCARLDLETGSFAWKRPVDNSPGYLTKAGECILLPRGDSQLLCLSAGAGTPLWSADTSGITGPVLAYENLAIAAMHPGALAAFELSSGEMRWTQNTEIETAFRVCGYGNSLIVLGRDFCWRISAGTGRVEHRTNIERAFKRIGIVLPTAATATEDCLFFSAVHEKLILALDLDSGDVVWSHRTEDRIPVYNAPVIGKRMYVVDAAGVLYAFRQSAAR